MKLIIKDIIGPRCITQEDGQKIYEKIHNPLLKGESIILNFEGVRQFASPFFNFAIGQLLKDIKTETLRSLLSFDHLTPAGKIWETAFTNQYKGLKPRCRQMYLDRARCALQ